MDTTEPFHLLIFFNEIWGAFGGGTLGQLLETPSDYVLLLLLIIFGLLFSAFFSGAEVAFFSLDKKLNKEPLVEFETNPALIRVFHMLQKPRELLATILIGNTFANIVTAVGAAVLTGRIIAIFGWPQLLVFTIEIIVLSFVIVILAEITPKLLAINNPLSISQKLSGTLYLFFVVLSPFSKLLSNSTRFLEKKIPSPPESISSEDLKTIAEVGEKHGSIHEDEREIIENVIEFGKTYVREIMTSRVNISAISTENTLEDVLDLIRERGISRLPVYEKNIDNIIGVIHSKDLLPYIHTDFGKAAINWKTLARKPFFIPPTKKLDDLLRDFQQEKTHIAIVVDEYGGTEGIITLDDVLEEIIGEISDEYTEPVELYTRNKSGKYLFDAKIDLDDMADILSMDLTTDEDEYETLGGLIYHILERIPEEGEKIDFKGLRLCIHKMDNNRLLKVEVEVLEKTKKGTAKKKEETQNNEKQ